MRPKVLWIEDSARFELSNLTGPVYFSGKYDFHLAEDVTTAVQFLMVKPFDVVIVDIRLPPGTDSCWRDLYKQANSGNVQNQLGIKLLDWMLSRDVCCQPNPPGWVDNCCLGVFSVENDRETQDKLKELGIEAYTQKAAGLPDTTLLEMIETIIERKMN
jgi:hypothetical protein